MSPFRRLQGDETATRPATDGATGAGGLIARLSDADPEVRRGAVSDLARLDAGEDLDGALTALLDRLAREPDTTVREAIVAQLARHDRPDVVAGLVRHLASDVASLRNAVAEALGQMPQGMAEQVPALLEDPDPDVRILTVMVLAALRLPQVEEWLTFLVTHDPQPNVTAAALGELVPVAGPRAAPVAAVARDRFPADPFIGYVAGKALAGLPGEGR